MLTKGRTDQLLVTRQDPTTRQYQSLGVLTRHDGMYTFA